MNAAKPRIMLCRTYPLADSHRWLCPGRAWPGPSGF